MSQSMRASVSDMPEVEQCNNFWISSHLSACVIHVPPVKICNVIALLSSNGCCSFICHSKFRILLGKFTPLSKVLQKYVLLFTYVIFLT